MEHVVLGRARVGSDSRIRLLRVLPGTRDAPHAHERSSITLVLRGALAERVGDEVAHAASLSLVVKPAGVLHAAAAGGDGALTLQLIVSAEDEARAAGAGGIGPWRWIHTGEAARPLVALARRLAGARASAGRGAAAEPTGASSLATSDEALEALFSEALAALPRPLAGRPGGPPPWLVDAREALRARAEPIEHVARRARVHPVHMAREFRRWFGVAPTVFRRRARLRRAAEALGRGDESLAGAAYAAGFSDQAHMSREFARGLGLTPRAFRRLGAAGAAAAGTSGRRAATRRDVAFVQERRSTSR